jgi:hypothetical protein
MDTIPATEMVTVRIPFRLACAIESALDMARCGVEITDVGHKQQIAAAQDLITDAILSGE